MTREIALTQGRAALVDDIDFEMLSRWKWRAMKVSDRLWYARTTEAGGDGQPQTLLMHRLILPLPFKLCVDHINGDGLDNRRANLRPAAHRENIWNSRRCRQRSAAGYIGVYLDKRCGSYRAYLSASGRRYELGSYATAEEAARVRDDAARKHHGVFAYFNFPDGAPNAEAAYRRLADDAAAARQDRRARRGAGTVGASEAGSLPAEGLSGPARRARA